MIPPNHGWIGDSQGRGGGRKKFSTHLIMTPTQQNVIQSTVWLVHTILGGVHGIPRVWVVLERLWVDDLIRKLAPHDESVPDDVPLTLGPKEEQEFSQVVNESGDLHPLRLSVSPDGFRGLQQMLDLRNGRLGRKAQRDQNPDPRNVTPGNPTSLMRRRCSAEKRTQPAQAQGVA